MSEIKWNVKLEHSVPTCAVDDDKASCIRKCGDEILMFLVLPILGAHLIMI
jgi:hypothetical protein